MKKGIFVITICSFVLFGCDTSNQIDKEPEETKKQVEVPKTYKNFVDCTLKTFDEQGEKVDLEGTVELVKKEEGTKFEWKYYELTRKGEQNIKLHGRNGNGYPNYNYGNLNFASLVNGYIKGSGHKTMFSPFDSNVEEAGVIITEVEGYMPLCCYVGVSDEEISYYKEEIETLKKSIRSAENVVSLEGKAACKDDANLTVCSQRLIEGYRKDIAKYEDLIFDKHYPEESCIWAKQNS